MPDLPPLQVNIPGSTWPACLPTSRYAFKVGRRKSEGIGCGCDDAWLRSGGSQQEWDEGKVEWEKLEDLPFPWEKDDADKKAAKATR